MVQIDGPERLLSLRLGQTFSHSSGGPGRMLPIDFRCSHVPPPPERVNHIWLENLNFTEIPAADGHHHLEASARLPADAGHANPSRSAGRSRRHVGSPLVEASKRDVDLRDPFAEQGDSTYRETTDRDSIWNLFRRLESAKLHTPPPDTDASSSPISKKMIQSSRDSLVPMKIQVYYDSSVYALDKRKVQSITETVIPTVVEFFEEVLLIRREYTIDKFRISRRCPNNTIYYAKEAVGLARPYCMDRCEDHAVCGEMIVPTEHLSACSYCNITSRRCTTNYATEGEGVANTQLLLYVSAKQSTRCKRDQTIAYAAHCAQDTKTDRPVAGHANLCPASISTDPKDMKALIATVKHELTHVLGFSVSLFGYYRDQRGRPLTERDSAPGPIPIDPQTGYAKWSDKVIRRLTRTNWVTGDGPVKKEIHLVVTPTVVREVRRHFNCSSLEGAELEDQGSDGTSMTHWEKRLFENEAMTGTHTQNSVYSRLTLAVLQDTGWYIANFTSAERLDWGRDLGCDFAQKSCKSWIDERRAKQASIRPFCDTIKGDMLQIACTEDRGSKAVCNMRHYKDPLPTVYQNFDSLDDARDTDLAHFGGSVDLADYCPFIQEFTWQVQNVTIRGSRCDLSGNNVEVEKNAALEHYSSESRCFEHGRRWDQRSCSHKRHWHHFGAGCYRHSCSNGHFNVLVGNQSYPCYYADQEIQIEQIVDKWLYNGSLICPPCDKICPPNRCVDYEKRLVDQIMNMGPVNNTDETLRAILDEALNSIDTQDDSLSFKKSYNRYKSILNETNQLIKKRRLRADTEPKASLISFDLFTGLSTRHPLLCSSADRLQRSLTFMIIMCVLCIALIL